MSGAGARPKVGIVVLNWNGWRDTLECLESLLGQTYKETEIIVVDNGSSDDSLERLREWGKGLLRISSNLVRTPARPMPIDLKVLDLGRTGPGAVPAGTAAVTVIRTGRNLGYAAGNNAGMRFAIDSGCDYVWVLNNDAVAAPDALEELVRAAEASVRAGIVGSRLYHYDRPDLVQSEGYHHWLWRLPFRKGPRLPARSRSVVRVKWAMGASLLARREMLVDVGLMDEGYFLFNEEADWCLRAARRGWATLVAAASVVRHKWGGSFPGKRSPRSFLGAKAQRLPWEAFQPVMYYEARNGIRFIQRNFPVLLPPYAVLRTAHLLVQTVLFDRDGFRRPAVILRGAWDGLTGRTGETEWLPGGRPGRRAINKVRVLVSFCRAYPPESGSASVTFDLARFLPGMVHLVQLAERRAPVAPPPGVDIIDVPGLPTNRYRKAFWLMTRLRGIARTVGRLDPPVIILEGSSWSLYALLLFRRLRRTLPEARIVYHAHNVEYALRKGKDHPVVAAVGRWAEGFLVRRSDLALAVSDEDAEAFRGLYGVRPEVLPNSVDAGRFGEVSDDMKAAARARYAGPGPLVLFMGLLGFPANDRAVDFLIREVFPGVREARPEARLMIVGGKLRETRPWIVNPGVLPFEELPAVVASSDVCVAPIFSGSGTRLKILESLAAGRPVVATTKGAEGLDLEAGRHLLIADTAEAFVAGIVRLLGDAEEAGRLSRQGREMVRARYSWAEVAARFERRLERLEGRGPASPAEPLPPTRAADGADAGERAGAGEGWPG